MTPAAAKPILGVPAAAERSPTFEARYEDHVLLFQGIVVGDFMELALVFLTMAVCFILMVVFGAWWAR